MSEFKAYLHVRQFSDKEIVHSVGLRQLNDNYVQRVMLGMLRNLGEDYYIDDSEVDEARNKEMGVQE